MIHRLLLVDDDAALVTILSAALAEEGFAVEAARDGVEGLRRFEASRPDLVILDVLLPELDGLSVCRRIRARGATPIILLSSRAEEVDRVGGLELGADDYVTKPFSTRELCARIRAIDRRIAQGPAQGSERRLEPGGERRAGGQGPLDESPLAVGALRIDPARFEVRWRDRLVVLTRSELLLLAALARQRGFVLARDRLLDLARGNDVTITERTVDTFIKRIRKKLRAVDPEFDEIETVFGVGYRYRQ